MTVPSFWDKLDRMNTRTISIENPNAGKRREDPSLRPYLKESREGAMMPKRPNFVPNKQVLSILQQNKPTVDMVRKTFGNEGDLAMSILMAENSRLNPQQAQIGGGPARGLWQFEPPTWNDMGGGDINDPNLQTQRAKQLRDKRGWGQWSAFNNKRHEEYLPYMSMIQ